MTMLSAGRKKSSGIWFLFPASSGSGAISPVLNSKPGSLFSSKTYASSEADWSYQMKYVAWFVLALLFPIITAGFIAEAALEAFLIGRAVFQFLREEE
jgi:hypothetical protein